MTALCGYAVVNNDGNEEPCNRPAAGWRWYQDCDHEDALDVACSIHANEGGRRIAEAEAKVARVEALLHVVENRMMATALPREIRAALTGGDQ